MGVLGDGEGRSSKRKRRERSVYSPSREDRSRGYGQTEKGSSSLSKRPRKVKVKRKVLDPVPYLVDILADIRCRVTIEREEKEKRVAEIDKRLPSFHASALEV